MSARDGKTPGAAEQGAAELEGTEPLFSAEMRAALRRDLGPDTGDRARVRAALLSSLATGAMTPAAERVDALMRGHGAGAAGAKTAAGTKLAAGAKAVASAAVHSLGTKLVVLGLVVAGGTTAIVRYAPAGSRPSAPAVVAHKHAAPKQAPKAASIEAPTTPQTRPALDPPAPQSVESAADNAAAVSASESTPRAQPSAKPALGTRHRASSVVAHSPAAPAWTDKQAQAAATAAMAATSAAKQPVNEQPVNEQPVNEQPVNEQPAATPPEPLSVSATAAGQASAQPTPPATPKHQLAAELVLVRAASEALLRGEATTALVKLRTYSVRYPMGALRQDADALQAIALCTLHDAGAAAVSRAFLRAHASSPLAERVRRACSAERP